MLGRYQMRRGKRPPDDPLPDGVRQDTRMHTRHVLRPDADRVHEYLAAPTESAWRRFSRAYRRRLEERMAADPGPFEALVDQARVQDVWLGCSCPTAKNPDVRRCHTFLALNFFADHFDDLEIDWPVPPPGD